MTGKYQKGEVHFGVFGLGSPLGGGWRGFIQLKIAGAT